MPLPRAKFADLEFASHVWKCGCGHVHRVHEDSKCDSCGEIIPVKFAANHRFYKLVQGGLINSNGFDYMAFAHKMEDDEDLSVKFMEATKFLLPT